MSNEIIKISNVIKVKLRNKKSLVLLKKWKFKFFIKIYSQVSPNNNKFLNFSINLENMFQIHIHLKMFKWVKFFMFSNL